MLTRLTLSNFKSFSHETLYMGPFTVIIGSNASGKSNLRDALRFLHGISRGYTIAEIIGEKWGEGGVLQWKGIRGGTKEAAFQGANTFKIDFSLKIGDDRRSREAVYTIEINPGDPKHSPKVVYEKLWLSTIQNNIFETNPPSDETHLNVQVYRKTPGRRPSVTLLNQQPIISQLVKQKDISATVVDGAEMVIRSLSSMRFLDLNLDAMRNPSIPGQTVLGDRGENLSSVLSNICENPGRKDNFVHWIRELTPLDVVDLEFPSDQIGRISLTLVEEKGQRISAQSASDGTLRFLSILGALLGTEPANFYFFEEIENGIHPSRLYLLINLIEQKAATGEIQIVTSSHSPQLLDLLIDKSMNDVSLTYRIEGEQNTRIKRISSIPNVKEKIIRHTASRLHATKWFEDTAYFLHEHE